MSPKRVEVIEKNYLVHLFISGQDHPHSGALALNSFALPPVKITSDVTAFASIAIDSDVP